MLRILDLSASRAREIATKQRFEHENQWIPLTSANFLPQDVGGNSVHLADWYHRSSWLLMTDWSAMSRERKYAERSFPFLIPVACLAFSAPAARAILELLATNQH